MKAITDHGCCGLECTRLTQAFRQTENLPGKAWLYSPGNAMTDRTTGFITPVLCALLLGDVPSLFSYLFHIVQFTLSPILLLFSAVTVQGRIVHIVLLDVLCKQKLKNYLK